MALAAKWTGVATKDIGAYTQVAEQAYAAAVKSNQATRDYMQGLILNGRSMGPVLSSVGDGFKKLAREEVEAGIQAARMAQKFDKMQSDMSKLSNEFNSGSLGLAAYTDKLQALIAANATLGKEKLESLRAALADAKERMKSFADASRDGLRSLQIEWAELNNQTIEAERLRQQEKRLEIEMQLAQARKDGNKEAIASLSQQLALLDKISDKRMQDLKDEASARAQESANNKETNTTTVNQLMPSFIPERVVKLQLGKAEVMGSEQAINDFISEIQRAGMTAV
jgi:chromosome segregation ATPase